MLCFDGLATRGIITKLQRKQELIQFLLVNNSFSSNNTNDTNNNAVLRKDTTTRAFRISAHQNDHNNKMTPPFDKKNGLMESTTITTESTPLTLPTRGRRGVRATTTTTYSSAKPKPVTIREQIHLQQQQQQQQFDSDDEEDDDESVSTTLSDIRQQNERSPFTLTTSRRSVTRRKYSILWEPIKERQQSHPIFRNLQNDGSHKNDDNNNANDILSRSDMNLIFFGKATSCTALRLNWHRGQGRRTSAWLFDVGEGTQLQIERTTSIKTETITKIFITHAHGDHSFGLPGLLCMLGGSKRDGPIEIYGPEGLRMWLRVAIRYSRSRIVAQYVVHELMDIPMAPEWKLNHKNKKFYNGFQHQHKEQKQTQQQGTNDSSSAVSKGRWRTKGLTGEDATNWISLANILQLEPSSLYGEVEGGRNIYPEYNHPKSHDGAPVWNVIQDKAVNVYAAPMSHTIPCVGYCIEEAPRPGRLRNELVEPIVQRNLEALQQQTGDRYPRKVMGIIRNLKPNTAFTFPDGTIVTQSDAVEAPRKGRKVLICGDTCDSRSMITLGQDADVVVHEATTSYLFGLTTRNRFTETEYCMNNGHSTPQMAGKFCRAVNGKLLVLYRSGSMHKRDTSAGNLAYTMQREKQAIQASGLQETQVAAAWDFMMLPIPQRK